MLVSAFQTILKIYSRDMTIERPDKFGPFSIKVTPSNYSRNLEGPSDIVLEGKEFVISKKALVDVGFPPPRRGDRLVDVEIGVSVISEVRELFDLGGSVLGYRVRTS